jgi:predicted MFS family arabinose efflux permease
VAGTLVPLISLGLLKSFDWRSVLIIFSSGLLVMGPILTWLFFHDRNSSARAGSGDVLREGGLTLWGAVKTTHMWRLIAATILMGAATGTIVLHGQAIMADRGISRQTSLALAATLGPGQILGRLIVGWILDRSKGPLVPAFTIALPIVGCLIYLAGRSAGPALGLAPAFIGFSFGIEASLFPYLASRYFGLANLGTIYGLLTGCALLSLGMAPALGGAARDAFGNYTAIIWAAIFAFLAGALLVGTLGAFPLKKAADVGEVDLLEAI